MNLNKFLKKELYSEQFNGCPVFMTMTTQGFLTPARYGLIPAYSLVLCYFKNQQGYWITSVDDQKKIAKKIISLYLQDPATINKFYQKWNTGLKQLLKFYYQEFPKNLKTLSDSELRQWKKQLDSKYQQLLLPGFLDAFMFYADQRLYQMVKNNEIFTILSAPVSPSFIQQQELEVHKLQQTKNKKQIQRHLLKYSWIKSSYAGYKKYNFPQHKISPEPSAISKNKALKKRLLKKYDFSPEIIALTELNELFVKWQDERKIYTLSFVALLDKFLKETAQRSKSKLPNQQPGALFVYSKEKTRIITGSKAEKIFRQATKAKIKKVKQLAGLPAYLGRVKGRVRIVTNIKQISKVKTGNILVTSMTRPEHLPAMKKASAIITDDGGLTCHASILARELKKPCLIGTKTATQILKNNDIIELDANKGIVKIL